MILSNKVYNILKPTVTVVLPAIQTLYFALATIWGLPNAEQVVGTIAAVNLFLGAFVGLGSKTYNAGDGDIVPFTDEDGRLTYTLAFNGDPTEIANKDRVVFRVQK